MQTRVGEAVMERRYDLFELPACGFPQWIDSTSDLSEAIKKMRELPAPKPGGEYLVRDFSSGMVVAYTHQCGLSIVSPNNSG